jgi:hypothetical protein
MTERRPPTPSDFSTDSDTQADQLDHRHLPTPEYELKLTTLTQLLKAAPNLAAVKSELQRWMVAEADTELGAALESGWTSETSIGEVYQNLEKAQFGLRAGYEHQPDKFRYLLKFVSRVAGLRQVVEPFFEDICRSLSTLQKLEPTMIEMVGALQTLDDHDFVFKVSREGKTEFREPAQISLAIQNVFTVSVQRYWKNWYRWEKINEAVDKVSAVYDLDLKVYHLVLAAWEPLEVRPPRPRRFILNDRYDRYLHRLKPNFE